jgi:hypothetical protein
VLAHPPVGEPGGDHVAVLSMSSRSDRHSTGVEVEGK